MKKIIIVIISVLLPVLAWGQAQINTKKVKIADFTQKITKVVLSGNQFQDSILQDGITLYWRISPYEFCTAEEFETIKSSDEFYFLVSVNGQFKKDATPTIQYLTLVKGGSEAAEGGINSMLEVVSMPVGAADEPSGREAVFMPALLDIIQDYTIASMEKDTYAYGGLNSFVEKVDPRNKIQTVFSINDLSEGAKKSIKTLPSEGITIAEEDEADEFMHNGAEGVAVSYVVAPSSPLPGAVCYRMIIDAYSHKLYYYTKGKVSKKDGAGFTQTEITKIHSTITHK